jgi:hypothetical protein
MTLTPYGYGTLQAWDALMAAETAAETKAEARRQEMAARPHKAREDADIPGFCECGYNLRAAVHR